MDSAVYILLEIVNSHYFVRNIEMNMFKGIPDEDRVIDDSQMGLCGGDFLIEFVLNYQGLGDLVCSVLLMHVS